MFPCRISMPDRFQILHKRPAHTSSLDSTARTPGKIDAWRFDPGIVNDFTESSARGKMSQDGTKGAWTAAGGFPGPTLNQSAIPDRRRLSNA